MDQQNTDRCLRSTLDALSSLIAAVTAENVDRADQVRADLEGGGVLILAYRPQAGRVEISLGTADNEPVTLFSAWPGKRSEPATAPVH